MGLALSNTSAIGLVRITFMRGCKHNKKGFSIFKVLSRIFGTNNRIVQMWKKAHKSGGDHVDVGCCNLSY